MKEGIIESTSILEIGDSLLIHHEEIEIENHRISSEPYLGKGKSFGFSGSWNCSWEPVGPKKNYGYLENSEPYTGKKK